VVAADVHCEGISRLTPDDIEFARRLGYVIKLVAIAEAFDDAEIAVRVHPVMVRGDHPLATVRDSFNAVFVEGEAVGELMLYGRGAGGRPTASAVLGDLVDAALNLRRGAGHAVHTVPGLRAARLRPMERLSSQFYFTLEVVDRPGVLEKVAGVTARHGVSIKSMQQEGLGEEARLVLITHEAREADMQATLRDLRQLDAVEQVGNLVRVLEAG
jgi:homoserine dehydrogenase